MNPSRAKALNTWIANITKEFEEKNGRPPTVKELNDYFKENQLKSRESYVKNGSLGGFRGITPERRAEISRLGVEARAKKRKEG